MTVQAIQEAIVKRLQTSLSPGLVQFVFAGADGLDTGIHRTQFTPSAVVLYDGYSVGSATHLSRNQAVYLRFVVAIYTQNAFDTTRSAGAREDVSPIFDAVLHALVGWQPHINAVPTVVSCLALAPAPGVQTTESGLALWPIAFTCRINLGSR